MGFESQDSAIGVITTSFKFLTLDMGTMISSIALSVPQSLCSPFEGNKLVHAHKNDNKMPSFPN